ncbi:hypothetical protein NCC49_005207 [Naganishia albida]|nr:hypothetical protein NCC49_005207 [Naganishia albida]
MDSNLTAFRRVEKHFKSRHAQGPEAVKQKKKQSKLLAALRLGNTDNDGPLRNDDYPVVKGHGVMNLSRTGERDEVVDAGWDVDDDSFGGREYEEIEVEKVDDYGVSETRIVKGYIIGDGLIYIPQYLSADAQLRLAQSSLEEYTRPPNPLNLSTHYVLPPSLSLFDKYVTDPEYLVDSKASASSNPATPSSEPPTSETTRSREISTTSSSVPPRPRTSQRELISNRPAHEEGYEALKERVAQWKGDEPSYKMRSKSVRKLLEGELRWANLGWVYNWTNKAYDFTTSTPIPFPSKLAQTCQSLIRGIPWHRVFGDDLASRFTTIRPPHWRDWTEDYRPDTGIVNFYGGKDTLMGHVDRSELDPYRPLVSISLGHACIFLIGGPTRDTSPLPLILRSGDAIVMSGASRTFYHGVPRVMEGTLPAYFEEDEEDTEERRAVKRFMKAARININARQVFPVGFVPGHERE